VAPARCIWWVRPMMAAPTEVTKTLRVMGSLLSYSGVS
jgi:hypothetical protein